MANGSGAMRTSRLDGEQAAVVNVGSGSMVASRLDGEQTAVVNVGSGSMVASGSMASADLANVVEGWLRCDADLQARWRAGGPCSIQATWPAVNVAGSVVASGSMRTSGVRDFNFAF